MDFQKQGGKSRTLLKFLAMEVTKVDECMPPPPPRKKQKVVLEEEEYLARMEEIIERDFFPDIPIMRQHLGEIQRLRPENEDWEETPGGPMATPSSGIGVQGSTAGGVTDTPLATEEGASGLETPVILSGSRGPDRAQIGEAAGKNVRQSGEKCMSLDEYLSTCTSEDNASFQALQEESLKRKRLKNAHYLEDKNQLLLEAAPPETDGYGTSGQKPGSLVLWKHVPKNKLFYDSSQTDVAHQTAAEAAALVQGAPKEIKHCNTRFPSSSCLAAEVAEPVANSMAQGDYSYVATPVPVAGVNMSPIMTWGELGSTPIRIDGGNTPEFKISELSQRDKMGKALATSARKSLAKRRAAFEPKAYGMGTPKSLSIAGKKLASSLRVKTPGTDIELRASYSGTPYKLQKELKQSSTPVRAKTKIKKVSSPGKEEKGRITDGLLNV